MTIYTDKIIVSFSNNNDYNYSSLEIKVCPICKVYKEIENFKSLQKHKEYNIVCRRCLDKQNSERKVFKSFKK